MEAVSTRASTLLGLTVVPVGLVTHCRRIRWFVKVSSYLYWEDEVTTIL